MLYEVITVVALEFAGLGGGLVDPFHAVQEAVAPVHEGLRVDVLVVLGEVQAALQGLVDDAAVILARQAQLRLDRGAQQRPTVLVEALSYNFV